MMRVYLTTIQCAIAVLMILSASIANAQQADIFASQSIRYDDLSAFPKWNRAIEASKLSMNEQCVDGECAEHSWPDMIANWPISGVSVTTLGSVNQQINQNHYVLDSINWGKPDFWASSLQFLIRNGDCEDYAIAKYMALKQIGFPAKDMRLVILQDENLGILHSVLDVFLKGTHYILDNQIDALVTDQDIIHYNPIYSINEAHWWRHYRM